MDVRVNLEFDFALMTPVGEREGKGDAIRECCWSPDSGNGRSSPAIVSTSLRDVLPVKNVPEMSDRPLLARLRLECLFCCKTP
jgi:hypothetical protein